MQNVGGQNQRTFYRTPCNRDNQGHLGLYLQSIDAVSNGEVLYEVSYNTLRMIIFHKFDLILQRI